MRVWKFNKKVFFLFFAGNKQSRLGKRKKKTSTRWEAKKRGSRQSRFSSHPQRCIDVTCRLCNHVAAFVFHSDSFSLFPSIFLLCPYMSSTLFYHLAVDELFRSDVERKKKGVAQSKRKWGGDMTVKKKRGSSTMLLAIKNKLMDLNVEKRKGETRLRFRMLLT